MVFRSVRVSHPDDIGGVPLAERADKRGGFQRGGPEPGLAALTVRIRGHAVVKGVDRP